MPLLYCQRKLTTAVVSRDAHLAACRAGFRHIRIEDRVQVNVTKQLAAFTSSLTVDKVPEPLRKECRLFVLDALSVMVGAALFARDNGDEILSNYLKVAAPPGPATVVGYGIDTTPMMAAFGNGTLSEVLDCQDTNLWVRSHNGTPVIPVALALSQWQRIPWGELVPAIIAGYEIHTRLLLGIQPSHWYNGFQGTGTFGTSGAAATAGRLLRLNVEQTSAALGASGFIMPVSNGDNQFKGHNIKPVHGGQAAMSGLSSALLAQAGYRAGPLEGEAPRYHAALQILSTERDLNKCVRGLGSKWHTLEVAFKPFPIGHLIIGAVEASLVLRKEAIDPKNVKSIRVTTFRDAVTFTGKKYTSVDSNHVDAHLSIPYSVAVALIDGQLTIDQLSSRRLKDPFVHELAGKVVCEVDEDMTRAFPTKWPVEVAINMVDGAVRKHRIDDVMWSPQRLPTWEELCNKFHVMGDRLLGADAVDQAIGILENIDDSSDLQPLMKLVRGPA